MSLNKFMHPRNKYKKPPDFKSLAIKYPEFRKYAKQEISGKVSLDFKNLEAIRALTTSLLKEDFDLVVEIPLTRLIPTLPLRLNYLLWLQDLLELNGKTVEPVKGIDIGCGASCVYPLLAAKNFSWHMLATEVDTESAFIASSNVKRNKLQDLIKVKTVDEKAILFGVLNPIDRYDFSMCNPPFFSSTDELEPSNVSRSASRPAPRNAHSGVPGELVTDGGETAFIGRMIEDSVKLQQCVRFYSVMVGHKTSVNKVKKALEDAGISKMSTTEFCQGHTTRWGVVWTFDETAQLLQSGNIPLSSKKKTPFDFLSELGLGTIVTKLRELMDQLQIKHTTLKSNQELCAMEIIAESNTWSNSRKKRRQEKLKQAQNNTEEKKEEPQTQASLESPSVEINKSDGSSEIGSNNSINDNLKRKHDEDNPSGSDSNNAKKFKPDAADVKKDPLIVGSLILKPSSKGTHIELFWLRGSGGRDAAHQIIQYFKNNLKTTQNEDKTNQSEAKTKNTEAETNQTEVKTKQTEANSVKDCTEPESTTNHNEIKTNLTEANKPTT